MRIALAAAPVREGTRRTSYTAPLPREIEAAPNYDTIRARPRPRACGSGPAVTRGRLFKAAGRRRAQRFAATNREIMMQHVVDAVRGVPALPPFEAHLEAVNCHHNYVAQETHFGARVFVTRKGAVRAGRGDLGIVPGSMGARSYIVRGKGNPESFESCSHGAGRTMSRTEAKRRFTVADHAAATAGVECRKDAGVIDETPMAYKPIDAVMAAQEDLVEIVHTLRQVVCVKG